MKISINPDRTTWPSLLQRPVIELRQLEAEVRSMIEQVQLKGFEAVRELTLKFDGYNPDPLAVNDGEITAAEIDLDPDLKKAINSAAINIELFHRNQMKESPVVYISKNIQCWQREVPIDQVGLYIPGGTAPLFSTVLMLGIPAKIAGCSDIVMCCPADENAKVHPAILYAAKICGIKNIMRVGGVQAIASLAFGVGGYAPVNKIFGPGNQYVTMAKQLVTDWGVAIDMPAGPSEVMVMADHQANPEFVAADLLSQAEHGTDSQVMLLCFNEEFASKVEACMQEQLNELPRQAIARKALENSQSIVLSSIGEMMDFANAYAAEHLILAMENARQLCKSVRNAGSVFIGNYSPESAGDYATGTNHTLPTNGYARSYSGLTLQSFMKTIQFQEILPDGIREIGPDVITMAKAERLDAHANSVLIRLKELDHE